MNFKKFEDEKPHGGDIIIVRLKDKETVLWESDDWVKLPCYTVEVIQNEKNRGFRGKIYDYL